MLSSLSHVYLYTYTSLFYAYLSHMCYTWHPRAGARHSSIATMPFSRSESESMSAHCMQTRFCMLGEGFELAQKLNSSGVHSQCKSMITVIHPWNNEIQGPNLALFSPSKDSLTTDTLQLRQWWFRGIMLSFVWLFVQGRHCRTICHIWI